MAARPTRCSGNTSSKTYLLLTRDEMWPGAFSATWPSSRELIIKCFPRALPFPRACPSRGSSPVSGQDLVLRSAPRAPGPSSEGPGRRPFPLQTRPVGPPAPALWWQARPFAGVTPGQCEVPLRGGRVWRSVGHRSPFLFWPSVLFPESSLTSVGVSTVESCPAFFNFLESKPPQGLCAFPDGSDLPVPDGRRAGGSSCRCVAGLVK